MERWLWLSLHAVLWAFASLLGLWMWLWVTRLRINAPGPPIWPLIGNLLDFWKLPLTMGQFRDLHRRYGDIFRFYVGPKLVVVIAHPDDLQQVLLTSKLTERDPYVTRLMRPFVGDGLLTNKGEQWKIQRKVISPTFHSEVLESFLDIFNEAGVFLSERLARTGGSTTDVYPLAFLASTRAVCEAVLSTSLDQLTPSSVSQDEMSELMVAAMNIIQKMFLRPWLHLSWLRPLVTGGRTIGKQMEFLQQLCSRSIAKRLAEPTDVRPSKKWLPFLETLVSPNGETLLPMDEINDEIRTMVIAGSDTSAVSVSFALAMLALHTEWQDAARQELREVFGTADDRLRSPVSAELSQLKVIDCIIKETLRLFPVVPFMPRQTPEDVPLAGGRVVVPRGTLILPGNFLTHHMPEFFPEPEKFDPSRFLHGGAGERHPCSYVPFGLGPRQCIGQQYSLVQIKVMLAAILRRLYVLPRCSRQDLERINLSITIHPLEGMRISCVPLDCPPGADI